MPALKPIRRGQLITPFGVGSMVDFPGDESLMTAGLDAWPFAMDESPADWKVIEERLQARLRVTHFRLPPDFRDPEFARMARANYADMVKKMAPNPRSARKP